MNVLYSRKVALNLFNATLNTLGMMPMLVFTAMRPCKVTLMVVFAAFFLVNVMLKFVLVALFPVKGTDKMNKTTLY